MKMMDGTKFQISKETSEKILKEKGMVFIKELDVMINISGISSIYLAKNRKKVEGGKQTEGFLHDGTRVTKRFGEWVIAGEEMPDDKGNSQPVKLDRQHYPEIASGCVATVEEYERIKAGENYYQVVEYNPRKNTELNTGGFTHIME